MEAITNIKLVKLDDAIRDIALLMSLKGWSDKEIDRLLKAQKHLARVKVSAFPVSYTRD